MDRLSIRRASKGSADGFRLGEVGFDPHAVPATDDDTGRLAPNKGTPTPRERCSYPDAAPTTCERSTPMPGTASNNSPSTYGRGVCDTTLHVDHAPLHRQTP